MTRVRAPCPFPPHDGDPEGVIDLGVRLRDAVFRRGHLQRIARPALAKRLTQAIAEERWSDAANLCQALADTWPVAATVDAARRAWTAGPDGPALVVMHRAAQLLALAQERSPGWPEPTPAWIKRTVGNRWLTAVEQRCSEDGAAELAEMWEVPLVPADLNGLPPAVRQILEGDAQALSEAQRRAVETYGLYGAEVPNAPMWSDLLGAAPPGRPGGIQRALAQPVELPGTPARLRDGAAMPTVWLVWDAPVRPIPVTVSVATVLSRLDGVRTSASVADELSAPTGAVEEIVRTLMTLGACTARPEVPGT